MFVRLQKYQDAYCHGKDWVKNKRVMTRGERGCGERSWGVRRDGITGHM